MSKTEYNSNELDSLGKIKINYQISKHKSNN